MNPLSLGTWSLVCLASAGFFIGCYGGWLVGVDRVGSAFGGVGRPPVLSYRLERVVTAQWVGIALLVGYCALQIHSVLPILRSVGGISAVLGGTGGSAYRHALLSSSLAASQTDFSSGSLVTGLLGYVLFLGTLTLFWGAYLFLLGKRALGLLPLALFAILSLVTLQRYSFVYSLLLFGISIAYYRPLLGRPPLWKGNYLIYIGISAVLVLIVVLPLELRGPGISNLTPVQSVAGYYVSGVGALNQRLESDPEWKQRPIADLTQPAPDPGDGAYTFRGLASLLQRFGVPVQVPPADLDYTVVSIFGHPFESNVYTDIAYFRLDFGEPGVFFLSGFLGFLGMWSYCAVWFRRRTDVLPFAVLLSTTILMSFFGLTLVRDVRYAIVGFVGFLLFSLLSDSATIRDSSIPAVTERSLTDQYVPSAPEREL
jgi:oligosaccharide repeat unit polymerase